MHTTQIILEVDVPNKNNHVYPRYVIERVVEALVVVNVRLRAGPIKYD